VTAPLVEDAVLPGSTEPDPVTPRRGVITTIAHVLGELLITVGVLLLLLCAYQLWWTNVESAVATNNERAKIIAQWDRPVLPGPIGPAIPTPSKTKTVEVPPPSYGSGFALLYIPRLRDKVWGLPVMEGVGLDVLAQGAGHYPGDAMPGGLGNFALAAHRATHNEPFRNIDQLQVGDKVYVQTRTAWYTYVLDKDQIVLPTDVWVVDPVPGNPGAKPTKRLITLTTCNPRWASYQRWIWWGHLVGRQPAGPTTPDGITGTA
jgi:sortase A